ncbi:MAG: PhnD/SsuA/transferrin family substrate-binding protein [Hyphomicrobiales bacterium]|nr:PhnD/SsuA/transferrin family substrate-binding protein [Hyphomicrobiales bacterium]
MSSPLRLALLLFALVVRPAFADEVRIGVLAFQGGERASRDFEPTVAHLARALPQRHFALVPLDLDGVAAAVAEKSIDFVLTNPGDYVDLESRFGVTRLATLESRDHTPPTDTVASVVVAPNRAGRPIRLADLAGRRLAVVADDAFGGWRVIWREMDDVGLAPGDLAGLIETGFPMQTVLAALREGRADAGVLRACLLEEEIAAGRLGRDEFAVVGERETANFPCRVSSRLYPDWPFARLAGVSPDLAKAVTASLLSMAPVDGRAWTAPQDYTGVHALFRQLKIGPYEHLARVTVSGWLRAHWHWVAAFLLAVGWWIVHVARVETLVRARTAALTREIGEREKAERSARLHREERDQFSRLGILGEMASNIAHELNQPLAAITNYAEGITRHIDGGRTDGAFLRDGARGIAGQAERAAAIIRKIRAFVRRREAKREMLDLDEVVAETLALFEGLAARRGIPIRVTATAGLPPVSADRVEIEQVLLNLLQNAVDAMIDRPDRDRGVEIRTRAVDGAVEVEVRDHGPGLDEAVAAHLFEPFFTTKPQGLGLGLSICRTIVESHGGRLTAANQPGGGLAMRFALPIEAEEPT